MPKKPKRNHAAWYHKLKNYKNTRVQPLIVMAVLIIAPLVWLSWGDKQENQPKDEVSGYEVRESAVYSVNRSGFISTRRQLFKNVSGVKNAVTGPDGYTIHFQPTDMNSYLVTRCANPSLEVTPYDAGIPNKAPWDFEKVGWAAEMAGCSNWNGVGGFLTNSPNFAYLRQTNDELKLVIRDVITNKESTFLLDSVEWNEMLAIIESGIVEARTSDYPLGFTGTRGKDGAVYYYSHVDAAVDDNKVLLAFANLTIAVDLQNKRLLGTHKMIAPPYNVAVDVFSFEADSHSPLIVVGSGWEGGSEFQAIYDLSGTKLRVKPIYDLVQQYYDLHNFETSFTEWDDKGVLYLHMYDMMNAMEGNINENDQKKYDDISQWPEGEVSKEITRLETELQNTGKFIEVSCSTLANLYCEGLVPGAEYKMLPGGSLQKL